MTTTSRGEAEPPQGPSDEDELWAALNAVMDPCSVTAGCPAGLVDLGLVTAIDVTATPAGRRVSVRLMITEPGCLMAAPFVVQATDVLSALPGVAEVEVQVDAAALWDESHMTDAYRERLGTHRSRRRRDLGLMPA